MVAFQSHIARSPAIAPVSVGFPSRRSRVRGPSAAFTDSQGIARISSKSGGFDRRPHRWTAARSSEVVHLRRPSWSQNGRIVLVGHGLKGAGR